MAGCGGNVEPPPAKVAKPLDLAAYRCPVIDDATRYEFERRVDPPKPDLPGALSRTATRKWIDALEDSEGRKGETGLSLIETYDRCRQAEPKHLTKPIS